MTKKIVIGIKQTERRINLIRGSKAFVESAISRLKPPSYIERGWLKAQAWNAGERPDHNPSPVLTRAAVTMLHRPWLTPEGLQAMKEGDDAHHAAP